MRVLVVGGGGQVARAVVDTAPPQYHVESRARSELDISDETAIARALEPGFDWLVNGAAFTAVDLAEKEREAARATNETSVGCLARAAAQTGCRLFQLSTDFVFDGTSPIPYRPSDTPNPVNYYGVTKLGGERAALETTSGSVVLRTAWVYAATGRNFVLTMLKLMRERPEVRVVCDQVGAPTWAKGLARAIWAFIGAAAAPGTYHWTDLGVASWYDFALATQEEALARGLLRKAVPVIPIRTTAYPTPARRPAFSVLDSQSAREVTGTQAVPARHWRENLRKMLDELRAA